MPWIRVTHAGTGRFLDINLDENMSIYTPPGSSVTEIQAGPSFVYTIRETGDEIWAAIKAAGNAPYVVGESQPFIQVAKPIKIEKTSARRKK